MGGGAARIHGLGKWLVKYGHKVSVITSFPSYPQGVVSQEYRDKLHTQESLDGVTIYRTWSYISPHKNSINRIWNYISFMFSSLVRGINLNKKYDVVIATSPPLFIGVSGIVLSKYRRVPLIFDIRDIWPDIAVEAGIFKPENPLILASKQLAKYIYYYANHLTPVTLSKKMKIKRSGIPESKISVVSNGVDFDQIKSKTATCWRSKLDLQGKFIIGYAGLIGIAQGIGRLINVADILRRKKDIHFLIVGDGVEKDELVKRVEDLELQNVTFIQSQPREEIPNILAEIDLSVVPLVNKNLSDAVPSKLLEAWACRKPVLLIAAGESAEIVRNAQGGSIVSPEQTKKIAAEIERLKSDPKILETYAENGYKYVKNNFDRKYLAKMMEEIIFKIVKK